jgi:NAD-dependent deacetylase
VSLERAARLLSTARHGLALTGAGVSAESGIPTFRGAAGLWRQYDPVKVASIGYFMADPGAYWKVSRERGRVALGARPNPGHLALAALEAAGHLTAVVTQNTDGLHRDAGSRRVIELHGSGRTVECLDCGKREPRSEVQARLEVEMPPRCPECGGGFLKPTVVLFGEPMPQAAVQEAFDLAQAADVMLVAGSSLAVYPAAQIPLVALRAGARMILVNAEPTPFDGLADTVIHGLSGEVLPEIVRLTGS